MQKQEWIVKNLRLAVAALCASSSLAFARGETIVQEHFETVMKEHLGCKSWETYARLRLLAASGDARAHSDALDEARASGDCRILNAGEKAHLEDIGMTGVACIRPDGEVGCYWVPSETISIPR